MANAFIIFQKNDESRAIVEAILADNPMASVNDQPGLVRVDAPGRLTVKRLTVEEHIGRDFDLRELQLHLVTISGNLDETDEEFTLSWN